MKHIVRKIYNHWVIYDKPTNDIDVNDRGLLSTTQKIWIMGK